MPSPHSQPDTSSDSTHDLTGELVGGCAELGCVVVGPTSATTSRDGTVHFVSVHISMSCLSILGD